MEKRKMKTRYSLVSGAFWLCILLSLASRSPKAFQPLVSLKYSCIFLLATRDAQIIHQPYMELLTFLGIDVNTHNRLVQHLFSINQMPLLKKSVHMSPESQKKIFKCFPLKSEAQINSSVEFFQLSRRLKQRFKLEMVFSRLYFTGSQRNKT